MQLLRAYYQFSFFCEIFYQSKQTKIFHLLKLLNVRDVILLMIFTFFKHINTNLHNFIQFYT